MEKILGTYTYSWGIETMMEYLHALVAATEGAVKRKQEKGSLQTKTDARTLAYIMAALYSGLLNYKMTEMPKEEIKKIR